MSKKFFKGFAGLSTLLLGVSVLPVPAFAGFQWVAPDATANQSSGNNGYVAPQPAMNAPEVISPVIISGDSGSSIRMVQPSMPPAPQPVYMPPTGRIDLATAKINVAPSGGDVVQGFGNQIPLALALRQILPPNYNFSIDQSIDADATVSYKGGKSWRETVNDVLAPLGLSAREQGTTLIISHVMATATQPFSGADTVPISSAPVLSQAPASMGHMPMAMPAATAAAMPARADVPTYNVNPADGWTAEHGDTLHKVLTEWCGRAGVELQWLAEYDYPVEASAHFSGSFEDAVRNLLAGFEAARPQPVGELHTNPNAGQMVLVVSPRGNSYSN